MGTLFVLCILAAVVILIVRGMYRDRKHGKACGGCTGCAGCRMQGKCHAKG
ncbi:MAG: FeoB-associated Cys-rich membrane protein [Eubacterium sp.]|nr:FeoB-associated Cys-rich membrane protein [Eubacterium sp.]